ncbi:MAG: hypothetical protein GY856_37470 [bacterium]|nr:hypothetical protein [bacterium]
MRRSSAPTSSTCDPPTVVDLDLDNWTKSGFSYEASVDVDGAATSGSAVGDLVGPSALVEVSQCMDFSGLSGGRFDAQGWVRLVQNETGTPTTWVFVAFFDQADCAGIETGLAGNSLAGDTGGAWQEVAVKGVLLPEGTLSVDAHFVVIADSDPGSDVDAGFDLLTLRYPATVIFVDGFESGDTSAWSSTTGE